MEEKNKKLISKEAVYVVLSEYWRQYKFHPFHTAIAFLVPAMGSIFTHYIPPLVIAGLVNLFTVQGILPLERVWPYIILFGGSWLFGEMCWRLGMHYLIRLETEGIARLGKYTFQRLSAMDYDFYSNNFVGTLTNKATSFSRGFEGFTDTLSFNVFSSILPLIFSLIVLWQYSAVIPLLLIGCIVVVVSITLPIIRGRSKLVALRHDSGSKWSGNLSDSITNILAVKSFANEKDEAKRFGELADDYALKFRNASNYQNLRFEMIISPLYVITNVIGLIAAIYFARELALSIGAIFVVFSYYSQVTRIFFDFNRMYRGIESSISAAAEFTQRLLEPPKINDTPDARQFKVSRTEIEFKNVEFGYGKTNTKFLNNFNLHIQSQQKIGLVGPSGGGKTTITKLLLRFVDIQSGSITIDGQNINEVTQESLRKSIAYVPQEPLLFHRSLYENIAYGRQDATMSEVVNAAKLAHAHEFIESLPQGYETLVGERGVKLSGGQRQRVAIARAILKNAPILILDEATSSLDSESEKYIQQGLNELMKNRTSVVIAHRLSTIKHLDRIIVLEDGKITQDGTHEELRNVEGMYKKLWSHQSGEFI